MKTQFAILVSTLKTSLIKVLLIILAFISPIKPLIILVGLCIGLDTMMGIWRSKRLKEAITSRKLSNIISKMVLYQFAVLLFFCIEKLILADIITKFIDIPLFLTKLVALTLISVEIKSMNESFVIIKGYSLWDKFKDLLKRAKSAKGEIENFTKKEEEK